MDKSNYSIAETVLGTIIGLLAVYILVVSYLLATSAAI